MQRNTATTLRLLAVGALLGLGAASGRAQTTAAPLAPVVPTVWTADYKKGDVLRYRTYIKMAARASDNSGDIVITLRSLSRTDVTDVTADGFINWDQTDEKVDATLNGAPIPPKAEAVKAVKLIVGKDGVVRKRSNPAADPFDRSEKGIPVYQSFPAPTAAVKVGESWTSVIPNPVLKNKTITVTSTYVANEKILGIDAIKIDLKADFPHSFGAEESEIVHLKETYWLDAKTHILIRAVYTATNPLLPFPAKNIVTQAMTTRVIAGQNDKDDPDGEKIIALPPKPAK